MLIEDSRRNIEESEGASRKVRGFKEWMKLTVTTSILFFRHQWQNKFQHSDGFFKCSKFHLVVNFVCRWSRLQKGDQLGYTHHNERAGNGVLIRFDERFDALDGWQTQLCTKGFIDLKVTHLKILKLVRTIASTVA